VRSDHGGAPGRRREFLRGTFESAADAYDGARPPYPDELFDDLAELANLKPGARLLEIGCATGKATRPLAERGYSVVCVELGAELAARAREDLVGLPVEIEVSPFEAWEGEPGEFDLVYAATAWHWLDPETRYEKAHRLLRPGGHLAFWSALHAFPADFDPFFSEIQEIYDEIGESYEGDWPPAPPEAVPDETAEIEASGLFDNVQVKRYVWETHYTADEYIALLNTFSGHIATEPRAGERLYDEIRRRLARRSDQPLRRHWHVILHVARKSSSSLPATVRRSSATTAKPEHYR
jgi:SAM-dependent methyltransferase